MKRISLFLLLISFSLAFSSSKVDLTPTEAGYQLRVSIPEYSLNEVNINEKTRAGNLISETFSDLDIKGYSANGEIGAPEVLSQTFEIALENDNINFDVKILDADTIELKSKLFPKQYYLIYNHRNEKREVFAFNPELYASFKNDATIKILDRFTFRNQKAATIQITPVKYDVESNTLIIIKEMKVNINMTKPTKVRSSNSSRFDKIMRDKFQNLRSDRGFNIPSTATRQNEDYLVIATSSYIDDPNLKALIDYRKGMFNVEVVNASEVGSTKDEFRSFIRDKMPTYCLLVGRYSDFPSHTFTFQFQQPTTVKSVAYYVGAQTSGKPNPDIALGLFFVSSSTQIQNVVNKTITAEANNLTMPNVYVGQGGNEQQMGSLAPNHCDKVVQQMGQDFFVPNGYEHVEVYSVISPKGGKTQVINAVNNGVRFVNYNGHGFVSGWQYGWGSNDISSLTNTEYFPTVLSCACLTGTFDQNSIAQVYAYDDNGPAAWIGAYESSSMGQHTMNYGFYEAIMDLDITKLGLAYTYGANATINPDATASMPPGTSEMQLMQWQYHIFGDPALETIHEVDPEPHVRVVAPNGGEEWEQYRTYDIKWSSNVKEKVNITLYKGGNEVLKIAESEENDGSYEWLIPEDFEVGTNYKIEIACINTDTLIDESDENFSIILEDLITEYPYVQNFDSFESETEILIEKWTQLTDDDIEWTVLSGPTPSRTGIEPDRTGPMADNTTGNTGNYLYVEASDPNNPGKEACMTTPMFNLNVLENPTLEFYAHMLSDTAPTQMGDLYLDITTDGTKNSEVIHLTDNLGDEWVKQTVDLSNYQGKRVQFCFRGKTGETWCSDICIDDFKVNGNPVDVLMTTKALNNNFSLAFNANRVVYNIPTKAINKNATLKLYDIKGKAIESIKLNSSKAGSHSISFDNLRKGSIATGFYLAKLEVGEFNKTISFVYKK